MNSQEYRNLQEAYLDVYENEQLDELSVNKMHDYINKAEKDRARLNKKWDQGTATSKERKKVFDREEGEARASKKIRQKTGKDSFRLNALDKLKSAITKESYDIFDAILEHLLDEAIYSEKGKAKAAEMIAKRSTPSGRAKSGKGANVTQIRQIRGSGRGRFDREGLGGTPMTPTMAKNPIKKQNYDGTGNKAARRAGTYSRFGYKESYDLYDIILSHLIDEGYAETPEAAERIMVNMSEEWKETILEITGGKGHPGYKAGSRDLGPMQSGHPADSSKRTMKGGTMSMRHGDHLGDLDDDDDDDDDDGLEAGLKDSSRKSRENVRKPLRNMVKTAAKRLNK